MIKKILFSSRFWMYFIIPQVVFCVLSYSTTSAQLQPVLSLIIVALSIGICVAFAPSIVLIFREDGPLDRADALALGIFCTWLATALSGTLSAAWRFKGQPMWMINNDVVAYFRYLNICGAILHMAAPGSITDRIPAARWIKIGIVVACAIATFFLVGYALALFNVANGWP